MSESPRKTFPAPSFNKASENLTFISIHWTRKRGPRLAAMNSGEPCGACRHAKRSKWCELSGKIMALFYRRSRHRRHRNRHHHHHHHHQQYMLFMSVIVLIILTYNIFGCSSLNFNVTVILCFVFSSTSLMSSYDLLVISLFSALSL